MDRTVRKAPKLDAAMTALTDRPTLTLSEWAALNNLNRNTASRAVAAGEVEGAYRIGGQTRIWPAVQRYFERRAGLATFEVSQPDGEENLNAL